MCVAQPDNATAFVLTVPDKNQCKQPFLTAARVFTVARFVTYIVCVCVCVYVCVCVCVVARLSRNSVCVCVCVRIPRKFRLEGFEPAWFLSFICYEP